MTDEQWDEIDGCVWFDFTDGEDEAKYCEEYYDSSWRKNGFCMMYTGPHCESVMIFDESKEVK